MNGVTREVADSRSSKRKNAGARAVRLPGLAEAFERYATPVGNRALIQRIYDNTDVDAIVGFGDYFQLKRRGGYPALEVHPGYTNGFRTEQDVLRRAGDDAPRWPSRRFHGAWGIDHPVDGASVRGAGSAATSRRATGRVAGSSAAAAPSRRSETEKPKPVCETCFLELPATGVCDACAG